jgi:hypothetical protein
VNIADSTHVDIRGRPLTSCASVSLVENSWTNICGCGDLNETPAENQCMPLSFITALDIFRSHLLIRYRHIITKAESLQPQREAQGGVIADEMGLGKTLTTISLIAVSLPRAAHFSSTMPSQSFSQSTAPLPRSRATLVVVPSTRNLHCVLFSGYPQLTWTQN